MALLIYISRRIAGAIIVIAVAWILIFLMIQMVPGDPAAIWVGPRPTVEQLEEAREQLRLDEPIYSQFLHHTWRLLTGQCVSIRTKRPVLSDLSSRLPASLELVLVSFMLSAILGVLIGRFTALNRGEPSGEISRLLGILGVSIPILVAALLVQIILSGKLGLIPLGGRIDDSIAFSGSLKQYTGFLTIDCILNKNIPAFINSLFHLIGPSFCFILTSTTLIIRMTRSSILDEEEQYYFHSLQGLGLEKKVIINRIALRPALIPVVTVLGLSFGFMLGNTIIIESIFHWPGIGQYMYQSALTKDYPALMVTAMMFGLCYISANLIVDILYGIIDPRMVVFKRDRSINDRTNRL